MYFFTCGKSKMVKHTRRHKRRRGGDGASALLMKSFGSNKTPGQMRADAEMKTYTPSHGDDSKAKISEGYGKGITPADLKSMRSRVASMSSKGGRTRRHRRKTGRR
jgi:hypothetical protein